MITAVNGGVEQIPFLLVYVVFPSSVLFLLLFSYISTHFSRRARGCDRSRWRFPRNSPFQRRHLTAPNASLTLHSPRTRRRATCNIVIGIFLSFFVFFGTVLSPNTASLHSGALVEGLAQSLPPGERKQKL